VIDSHCHVWRVDLLRAAWRGAPAKIRKTLRIRDLLSATGDVQLTGIVLVEAGTSDEDNRWLTNVASRNPQVLGFVTFADPLDHRLEKRLDRWRAASKFRGVRFRLEGIHDADFPATPRFTDALRLIRDKRLVAELLIEPRHMRSLSRALDKVHGVKTVVDHLAKPSLGAGINTRARNVWEEGMRALAESPSTFCKLSLSLPANEFAKQLSTGTRFSDVGLVGSYTRFALTEFGASRSCWGSDWPLSSLFAPYEAVLQVARAALHPLNARDAAAVFHDTAADLYSI